MNKNPFITNGYEGAEYFCDRERETAQLVTELANGNNVALIAPRRMGKSCLIHHCFADKSIREGYNAFYVDIYSTNSLQELVFRMSREILTHLKPRGQKAVLYFWQCLRSLQSGITLSPMGDISFNLQIGDIVHGETTLEEIFHYLSTAGKPCIVAIDEFQQICEYGDRSVEALLRTYVQRYPSVRFIFAGSQRRMMGQIFQSPARPFYQSVTIMSLDSIARDKYEAFASRHFSAAGKRLGAGVVDAVYGVSESVTWYVQKLMNTLYAHTSSGEVCEADSVEWALNHVIDSMDFSYREQMFRIPEKQKLLLIAIAKEVRAKAITSGAFIRKYRLAGASSIQSAAKALQDKQYVTYENGAYLLYDIFFAIWLRRNY